MESNIQHIHFGNPKELDLKYFKSSWITEANQAFLIISLLVFSSNASWIAKSDFILSFVTLYSVILNFFKNRNRAYILGLIKSACAMISLLILYSFMNGKVDVYSWMGLYIKYILAYSTINYCGSKFESGFINIVYRLSIVSLFLYIFQLINFNLLYNLNNFFGIPSSRGLNPNSNSLIFNMIDIHSIRNCGFMWEPGAFAAVLIIALLISFKRSSKLDYQKAVLVVAIISTYSSMGYISLLIVIVYFSYEKLKYYSILLIIPLSFVFYNFNILSEKIGNQINDIDTELLNTQYSDDYVIHLNRFASFYADYETFVANPYMGLGIDIYTAGEKEYYKEYDQNVVRTSGLMALLVKVGSLGFLVYMFLMFIRVKNRYRDNRFAILFMVVIIVILFSNPIELSPIVLMLLTL